MGRRGKQNETERQCPGLQPWYGTGQSTPIRRVPNESRGRSNEGNHLSMKVTSTVAAGLLSLVGLTGALADVTTSGHRLVTQRPDDEQRVVLQGGAPLLVTSQTDCGVVADDFELPHLQILLKRAPRDEQTVSAFIDAMHLHGSSLYHRWLTAREFGARFGANARDIGAVTGWLQAQGFSINQVYPSRMLIDFHGNAGQVRKAFHTEIHSVETGGLAHFANQSAPQIPAAFAPAVSGILDMSDFQPRALHRPTMAAAEDARAKAPPSMWMTPANLAVIYHMAPAFELGITGRGQTIAIISLSDLVNPADWSRWRKLTQLDGHSTGSLTVENPAPPSGPSNCTDPGANSAADEATLDVEWSTAAAPGAHIALEVCAYMNITIANVVNSANPPNVMSISYAACELDLGPTTNALFRGLYQQAVAEGVSVFVATGDSGPVCSGQNPLYPVSLIGHTMNGLATTEYNVAVGGTDFSDTYSGANASYWNTSAGGKFAAALSYIPETPWNQTCANELILAHNGYAAAYGVAGQCNAGLPFGGPGSALNNAGGGGPSTCGAGTNDPASGDTQGCLPWPKPSWQAGVLGISNDGARDTPDVALFASGGGWGHGYTVCQTQTAGKPCVLAYGSGGTSYATPIWAGIQALINQSAGQRQGNPNVIYYQLAAMEYKNPRSTAACDSSNGVLGSTNCVFHDVTFGDINAPCTGNYDQPRYAWIECFPEPAFGVYGVLSASNRRLEPLYVAAPAYDMASGLGTPDVTNLIANWPAP